MFNLIFAIDENNLVGNSESKFGMPWHYPEDLKFYKEMTVGKKCIMGRTTYDAIGGALPNRSTYVVTRNSDLQLDDAEVVTDINQFDPKEEWMVCGGVTIFEQFIERAEYIYITRINKQYNGDVYYDQLDLSLFELETSRCGENPDLIFEKWKRRCI